MIYSLIIVYVLFGMGYGVGRHESGATIGGAFIAGLLWPFWLGYNLGRWEPGP